MESLAPPVFSILSALVEERLGLHHGPNDIDVFATKVLARMEEAGFHSALDYYYFLRYDPASQREFEALTDALVVGETYFFREVEPLRAALEHVVRPRIESAGAARIWCTACATGEEPLSIAMLLADAGLLDRCEIVATDVSERAIRRARANVFGTRSTRVISAPLPGVWSEELAATSAHWLRPVSDGVGVDPLLHAAVDFRQFNLMDQTKEEPFGLFDLVVCRNVLIYFDDATVRTVVEGLSRSLRPDGKLLVGASESLLRFGTMLHCEERGGAFFYAKEPT